MKRVLILGAGTGGTMMANKLVRVLPARDWRVTVVDRDDDHYQQAISSSRSESTAARHRENRATCRAARWSSLASRHRARAEPRPPAGRPRLART
jgi:2-polyprenyl-6-methoxyphenol hydroxylase-like FAD-dependent oxidoreductase